MKALLRISDESPEYLASSLGAKMLAKTFDQNRSKLNDHTLIVEETAGGPVYMVVGPSPPELVVTGRQAFGVFSPPESHDPVASFVDFEAADTWAQENCEGFGFEISAMSSGEQPQVCVSVAVMIRRNGKILFCRLDKAKQWSIPEVSLSLGESVEAAARRAAEAYGIKLGNCYMPGKVPYVNTYFGFAGRHIVTLCMAADIEKGRVTKKPAGCDKTEWLAMDKIPRPLFPMLEGMIAIVDPDSLGAKKKE